MTRLSWLYELAVLLLIKGLPFLGIGAVLGAMYLGWRAFR